MSVLNYIIWGENEQNYDVDDKNDNIGNELQLGSCVYLFYLRLSICAYM